MIKKTLTYTDFNGNKVTEDAYFHLTKSEVVEMEIMGGEGTKSFSDKLKEVGASKDGKLILKTFKDILRAAYGRQSEDGRRFVKKPEFFEEFLQSEAYSELFMQLVTDAEFAVEFVKGLLPSELVAEAEEKKPKLENPEGNYQPSLSLAVKDATDSFGIKKPVTKDDIVQMTEEEFAEYTRQLAKK